MSNELVKHLRDAEFESSVAKGTTLVDFWAPWCGPCRMVAPVLDELATELQGQVTIAKINVDDEPQTAGSFGIMSIPTLLLFKDGKALGKLVGAQAKSNIKTFIEQGL
jgi:thioredoxin 1